MEIIGYIAAILIGISLGMIGSGGSILTVPVLVYLMGMNPLLATTSSLFIVGTASLAGGLRSYTKGQVDFKAVTEFGIPSVLSIFVTTALSFTSASGHYNYVGQVQKFRKICF